MPLTLALFALALRCYGLDTPLLDYHSWRQADTAAIARNFVAHGYRLGFPEVDWGGRLPGYVESEFPLYTYSLALLYGLFGVHEWIGRLLTALCSAGAVAALYALARPTLGRRGAAYAGLTLAIMPYTLFFGRTVMPDSLMLLTAILALLSFRAWQARPTPTRLLAALLCGALAPLAKTPNLLVLAPPLAYLALSHRPRRWPALLLYGGCFALPALLWTLHARTLPLDPRLSFGIGEKLLDTRLLTDPQFYLLIARWSLENLLTWAGLPLLLLGLLSKPAGEARGLRLEACEPHTQNAKHKTQNAKLPHAWLLGALLFLAVGAAGVVGQDYYILPLAGPLAWFVGAGVDRAQRWAEARVGWRSRGTRLLPWAAPLVALGLLGGLSLARVAPLYRSADFYQTLGHRVDLALPPGERVGVIAPAVSEILYYAGRTGWRLDPGVIVPGGLASLGPDLGVRYVLIVDPWLTDRRDLLLGALTEFRRVPVGPYALLLDLSSPGVAPPFELPPETGHLVVEPFLSAWRAAGGVDGLGFPISDALDQPEGRAQFFERGLLVQQGDTAAPAP
ncbi:MAG TPA: glycosyltransferase family 39 protein, partial [Roseiflexaceae bacterium]|nr:glycosyltransferase family 39 protein [Roseiflexaceae bacterium]